MGVACTIAERAALDTGQNHVVARLMTPRGDAVYPTGHHAVQEGKLAPVFEITSESESIRFRQMTTDFPSGVSLVITRRSPLETT